MSVQHVLTATQFTRDELDYVFRLTDAIRRLDKSKEGLVYLQGLLAHKRAMLYFTQPSTRTFLSFESACHILGMRTSHIRDAATSSERKGESIEDSLRTFSSYVDVIIMRTPESGLCSHIASVLDQTPRPIPVINAGSGADEHPTQALLDMYTLHRSFCGHGGISGKTVLMVGDLKRGRTVRSLCNLLCLYSDVKILLAAPKEFQLSHDIKNNLTRAGVIFEELDDIESGIGLADAVYMTRVQDEYDVAGESQLVDNYERFYLRHGHLQYMRDHAVIMHPFPRRQELAASIDNDPRAKYWRQERNGMWTRVALLTQLLGVDKHIIHPEL